MSEAGGLFEGKDITQDIKLDAEVCVIGSGAGGAVVAKELSEYGHSVVLLEEGGKFTKEDFERYHRNPIDAFIEMYRDFGATATLGRPFILLPIGRALGGTTLVNSGTCFRTPDKVLRRWRREFGIEGVEPEDMKKYFDKVESFYSVRPATPDILGRNNEIFLEGAKKLGYSGGPLKRNMDGCRGCGVCTLGCPEQAKRSTDLNYIPSAISYGARVYCDARAEKILVKNDYVVGVEGYILDRKSRRRKHRFSVSSKLVVLCAGAIHTPYILLKNKLANSSGQVGKNLRIHPGIRVSALFEEDIKGWLGIPQGAYVDEFADEGIMLEGVFVGPWLTGGGLPYFGEKSKELMFHYRNIGAFGAMIFDETRGRVWKGPMRPIITYQLIKEDVKKASKAIAYASEIWFASGAKKVFPAVCWMPEMTSIRQVRELLQKGVKSSQLEMMAFHPMGTCRMGVDRRKAVVDPYGETFDVRNLFICDASIFPTCLGVNPMESIMAFATRSAEYIHQVKLAQSV